MQTSKQHFRVSGKITRLLGRESVSESIVALFEILKNSHDADALSVTVSFRDVTKGTGKIIISEKGGDGMIYKDIVDKFFVIGTYSKQPEPKSTFRVTSRYNRTMLGSKGVGRFALERLGHQSRVISRPINSNDKFTFLIDWDKFEPENVTVDQVGIDIVSEKEEHEDSGLEIEITNLRDIWNEDAIKTLEAKIQRLILPPQLQPPNSFNIILDAPEFGYNNKLIAVELAKRAYYSLKAELRNERIKVIAKIKDTAVISAEKGNDIIEKFIPYQAGAKLTETEQLTDFKYVKDLTCGPARLFVYYFPAFQSGSIERRDALNYYGEVFANLLDTELPKFGGVRIFRDGLRAFTYGDPKHDWVERSSISRNYSGTIQADRLIGYVLISNADNSQIKETTTRESAIEDQAFLDLREFVIQSMLTFDRFLNKERRKVTDERRNAKRGKETITQLQAAKKRLVDPQSSISKAIRKVADLYGEDITKDVDVIVAAIDNAQDNIKLRVEEEDIEMTQNQIQLALASLGYITSTMIHETNKAIGTSVIEVKKLRNHVTAEKKVSDEELHRIAFKLFKSVSTIDAWNRFVDRFTSGLTVEEPGSRKEEVFAPYQITEDFIKDAKEIYGVPQLEVNNHIDQKLQIRMFSAFFESIVGNLITNSIKAFDTKTDNHPKGTKITIRSDLNEQSLILYYSDNGPGIPKDLWDVVFDSHVSSTSKGLLGGHGMGLPIVRSLLRNYDGDIEITDPIHGQGTTFKIHIPWKSIKPTGKKPDE